ncbi:alcohol dehydrogenase catalytic domain-containing protein [Streptomyces melanosporofaciens]|uniref:2-deoxy-scyllo-inosamine dehydrogenase n=1 Tax=Streptomyces melanosporofaciens TaxID=67327 RepID=A0A1H4KFV8_STRMJ|nr:alcohol dehydrogenase catalytic domain-containing protein [Streptomyces melanosporofaciens]SEB57429.1 alcohol dehydrogenase [Streptomyces melanosporofaciens]
MTAATMRAARMHAVGKAMEIENLPVPEPGPGEVRVSVRACNVVPNLANVLSNWTTWFPQNPLPTLPAVFGLDPAGIVDAVGPNVEGVDVGERVYVNPGRVCTTCRSCRDGYMTTCESFCFAGYFGFTPSSPQLLDRYPGGLAEYMIAPQYALVRLPDDLAFESAARFGYLGTMYAALRKLAPEPGSPLLVNGINGTLGIGAALLAPHMGVTKIYGTGRDRALLDRVQALCPGRIETHSLHDGPVDDWIAEETGGRGVDMYIDALGPGAPHSTFLGGMRSLARGGRAVNIGAIAGEVPIDVHSMMDQQQSLIGSCWFTPSEGQAMSDLTAVHALDLSVFEHRQYPLDAVNEAISQVDNSGAGGFTNFVVCPAS